MCSWILHAFVYFNFHLLKFKVYLCIISIYRSTVRIKHATCSCKQCYYSACTAWFSGQEANFSIANALFSWILILSSTHSSGMYSFVGITGNSEFKTHVVSFKSHIEN